MTLVKKHKLMLYWVNKILVWLRRSKYSRGFGVQSPWAYQFIRYVINEHYPYYSYAELKKSLPDISSRESKVAKLYFRIANYRQADVVLSYNSESSVYDKYISAACHKTAVKHLDNASQLPSGTIEMLILPINFFLGMDHILGKTTKEFIPLTSNANFVMGMNITW